MGRHDDLRRGPAGRSLMEPADEADHLLQPLGVNALLRLLDQQQFRGFGRVDQGEQAQKQDRPIRGLLGANRAALGRLEDDPLSDLRTGVMLARDVELST